MSEEAEVVLLPLIVLDVERLEDLVHGFLVLTSRIQNPDIHRARRDVRGGVKRGGAGRGGAGRSGAEQGGAGRGEAGRPF